MEYAIKLNFDLINMSLCSPKYNERTEELCRIAHDRGILIVAAAGNNYSGAGFPAAYRDSVIGAVSINDAKIHVATSNIWSTNDISAPGNQIFSSYKNGTYCLLSGTSMAAAHITGIMALGISLLKQKGKKVDIDLLEHVLKSTAEPLSSGIEDESLKYRIEGELSKEQKIRWFYGHGLVKAEKFIEKVNDI